MKKKRKKEKKEKKETKKTNKKEEKEAWSPGCGGHEFKLLLEVEFDETSRETCSVSGNRVDENIKSL